MGFYESMRYLRNKITLRPSGAPRWPAAQPRSATARRIYRGEMIMRETTRRRTLVNLVAGPPGVWVVRLDLEFGRRGAHSATAQGLCCLSH